MKLRYITLICIGVLLFITVIFGVTYAYFGSITSSSKTDINLLVESVDKLEYDNGASLILNQGSHNLADGMGNISADSYVTVSLTANEDTNVADTKYYDISIQISDNNFVYSDGSTAELLLQITDPEDNLITSIDNLTYKTVEGISGFDVTTVNDLFVVKSNYSINSDSSTIATTHQWGFKLIMLNLPIDQAANAEATFNSNIIIDTK